MYIKSKKSSNVFFFLKFGCYYRSGNGFVILFCTLIIHRKKYWPFRPAPHNTRDTESKHLLLPLRCYSHLHMSFDDSYMFTDKYNVCHAATAHTHLFRKTTSISLSHAMRGMWACHKLLISLSNLTISSNTFIINRKANSHVLTSSTYLSCRYLYV